MRPNLDRKGRIVRGLSGAVFVAAGVAVLAAGWPASAGLRWVVALVAMALGGFQLFEAKRGWCVARACGVRTPI